MKLTIERADLLRSLGHVQSVVERRNTIPILSNVLLQAQDDRLALTATDMDLEIIDSVAASIGTPGAVTAPAHTLYDIVRKLPDGAQVELDSESDPSFLTLRSGRSRFRLGILPVEDYPRMSETDLPEPFTLKTATLREIIDRTRFAISTEETRYYLNGIYLHSLQTEKGEVMRAVATDGHRLARVELPLPMGAADLKGAIIPRKTVNEVRKLLDEGVEEVQLAISATKIRITLGHVTITSKLIDGTFPDYERVIPKGNELLLNINPKLLAEAVDRVSTISTEKSRAIKLALDQGTVTLSAQSAEHGSATESLEADYGAEPIEIGFNSRYLLDIMSQINGDSCAMALADAASPTLIQDHSSLDAVFVLMPMRVA